MASSRSDDGPRQSTCRAVNQVLPRILPEVTERLAAALSGQRKSEPDWGEVEWRVAGAVAVIHGISPLLSRRLSWGGTARWRDFLENQHHHTAQRYGRMRALLDIIDTQAARAGLPFVPLKGAALHAMGVYAAGERPMADIDLLLRPQDLSPMNKLLATLGYREVSVSELEHVLVPVHGPARTHPTEHADNGITIELHGTISRAMPVRPVDITPRLWPSAPRPGHNDYPSPGALMAHLLMHAAVNMQMRILRMIQLHDIALLAPRLSQADWSILSDSKDGVPTAWWAWPPLQLMRRYYPGAIPAGAIKAIAADCPALLRMRAPRLRLTEVSVSNPRRPLLPALLWARSLPEACAWVGKRLSHGIQAIRSNTAPREASELQPWIAKAHRRRALDVLLGRPRPETMMILTAALQNDAVFGPGYEQPKVA